MSTNVYGTGAERERAERRSKRHLEAMKLEREARDALEAATARLAEAKREVTSAETALANARTAYARARGTLDACLVDVPDDERDAYKRAFDDAREAAAKEDRR